jgi:hypothetical protein
MAPSNLVENCRSFGETECLCIKGTQRRMLIKEVGPPHALTYSDPGVSTFRDNLLVLSSRVSLDFLTLKMTGDRLLGSDSCSMLHAVSKIRRNINNGYFNAVLLMDN